MPGIINLGTTVYDYLKQRVYVGGSLRSDVYCVDVQYGAGTAGSTASFELPSYLWDSAYGSLKGKKVLVEVSYDGAAWDTVFLGRITSLTGTAESQTFGCSAQSLMQLSHLVYLGEGASGNDQLDAKYPEKAINDSGVIATTGWTLPAIIRDVFGDQLDPITWRGGGGALSSEVRSQLKFGSISILQDFWNQFKFGDLTFRQATLKDFLDQIMSLVGSISYREEFRSTYDTYIHMFKLNDDTLAIKDLIVGRPGELASDSNVAQISYTISNDAVIDRIRAIGDNYQFMISVANTSTPPLRRLWDASLEEYVLANPERAQDPKASWDLLNVLSTTQRENLSYVFKRFGLPNNIRKFLIDDNNLVEFTDGRTLEVQVWKYPNNFSWDGSKFVGTTASKPIKIDADLNLAQGYFTLNEPALNVSQGSLNAENEKVEIYAEAVIGITLTVRGPRLYHDTGSSSASDFELEDWGQLQVVENTKFGYKQITNAGYTSWFGDVFYPCIFYDETQNAWLVYTEPVVTQDDRSALEFYTEASLEEQQNSGKEYSVTIPYYTNAYKLGDRVRFVGQDNVDMGVHQIQSIAHNLTNDHSTTISTSSAVPLVTSRILGGS